MGRRWTKWSQAVYPPGGLACVRGPFPRKTAGKSQFGLPAGSASMLAKDIIRRAPMLPGRNSPRKRDVRVQACQVGVILSFAGAFANFVRLNFLHVSGCVRDSYVTTFPQRFCRAHFCE